jgi:hypothetical protein
VVAEIGEQLAYWLGVLSLKGGGKMMISKQRFLMGAGLSAVLTWIAVAHAGSKGDWPVALDTANRTASGAVGSSRNSPDSKQYIGCTAEVSGTSSPSVHCFARDAAGTTRTCTRALHTSSWGGGTCVGCSPDGYYSSASTIGWLNIVTGISADSYIEFDWDASNQCTRVMVENSSVLAVKAP